VEIRALANQDANAVVNAKKPNAKEHALVVHARVTNVTAMPTAPNVRPIAPWSDAKAIRNRAIALPKDANVETHANVQFVWKINEERSKTKRRSDVLILKFMQ